MNKRLMYITFFSFSLLLGLLVYVNIKLMNEKDLLKTSSINIAVPANINNSKIYGFKDILELTVENKNIKILKLGSNAEDKRKVNVEIEYNGDKNSLNNILELVSSKENVYSINNITLISTDVLNVKATVNIDFIKTK